jgi:hypothetical protein
MRNLLFIALLLALIVSGCGPMKSLEFEPLVQGDPLQAHIDNWKKIVTVSGAYTVRFTDSAGKSSSVLGNIVIVTGEKCSIELASDRGNEALIVLSPEQLNLVNHRENYYLLEKNSVSNSERMVGMYLPSQELAAVLSGSGFVPDRTVNFHQEVLEQGGLKFDFYHLDQQLRASGKVDSLGRLRTISYFDTVHDETILRAEYNNYFSGTTTGEYLPGKVAIYLPQRREGILLTSRERNKLSINAKFVLDNMERIFSSKEIGTRIDLEDIPAGPPILYRNLRQYVEKQQ